MELLNMNIEELSYKDIKAFVDSININEERNNAELVYLIDKLALDTRKNVKALSVKLNKEKEKNKTRIQ